MACFTHSRRRCLFDVTYAKEKVILQYFEHYGKDCVRGAVFTGADAMAHYLISSLMK